ncbi:predicted protein [Plenodomus lingam JN3]|uniref:Predicted protein n=1 Tax=Leptosphaeria maculans (strain JN3 / isolate v23.1.3 / race Av1-4-5-6-7-8) TaxID=985895 RepID=E5A2M0_LEPMJ|nr:predicted protein [Plenodomus lingam JN3]CBX97816.1 predicted protein [Plenodomus lingam JN3]
MWWLLLIRIGASQLLTCIQYRVALAWWRKQGCG